ncbi:MAG: hydantoinase B/oxoprolinase family protein [Pseudomonadota bacterium]
MAGWQFWIDRGGTFTDVVARDPDGGISVTKLLSENPEHYDDAALEGIRRVLGTPRDAPLPANRIDAIKMGTTVATNALLERKGEPTVLAITQGFGEALRIGYQQRPDIFARRIVLPSLLYGRVVEVVERIGADGVVTTPLDEAAAEAAFAAALAAGFRAIAIVTMHAWRNPEHERRLGAIAARLGFTQISLSHQVSPLIKLVGRGDTTVVDAYLSPILRRYVDRVAAKTGDGRLMFMQSNGGLVDAHRFQGKDAILSGPAGGVVGAVETAKLAGFEKIVGFDMGGTSTDVTHYAGELERRFETEVAGVRMRAPMMAINTVAAGGGSIVTFERGRFRVGPESAGANPGPACYRRGGPLTVTDCNLAVGKLQADLFPAVFGPNADQPLDATASRARLEEIRSQVEHETGIAYAIDEIAHGALMIADDNMANAIKEISIQRGYDVHTYTLVCFGGAGGQHACNVADALGITRVMIHPLASVLSAYGIGLADLRCVRQRAVEAPLDAAVADLATIERTLADEAKAELRAQGIAAADITTTTRVHLRYEGTVTPIPVAMGSAQDLRRRFEHEHKSRYGFVVDGRALVIEQLAVEGIGAMAGIDEPEEALIPRLADAPIEPLRTVELFASPAPREPAERWTAPVYDRAAITPGDSVAGPALIVADTTTVVVDPEWRAMVNGRDHLVLERLEPVERQSAVGTTSDPIMLEIFNNLFMTIAEQMGVTLQNTAYSVNVKERLDFSCAVFDPTGGLVANAPHMPVHLGSMSESVRAVLRKRGGKLKPGDAVALNDPYNGGTHLPDVTVIMPVFDTKGELIFLTGSRAHHADIGGITPGSMPADSTHIHQEGVLFDDFTLMEAGEVRMGALLELLRSGPYPARNPEQNVADLQAQIASCHQGARQLLNMVEQFGLDVVQAYMGHVQANAAEQVRLVLDRLQDGRFVYPNDMGQEVHVEVTIDKDARRARVDFTGSSTQAENNFNCPAAVTRAAVLYVFRTLVDADIPLNEGCLEPIDLVLPEGSLLDCRYPAAVCAGNVETSQWITDTLFGALGVMAAAQGTMNNLTYGNAKLQNYETTCGGSGAGPDYDGTSAVHTHMTNSRLTDPELLELRFPLTLAFHEINHGSGGRGAHKGGDGTIRKLLFHEPMEVIVLANHREVPPFGLQGGEPGAVGRQWIERKGGTIDTMTGRDKRWVEPGDALVLQTPAGGGYGEA